MKKILNYISVAVIACVFVGCCACRSYQKRTRRPLVGTEWQLIQLNGRDIPSDSDSERFTVRFAEDGTFSGVGSCNRLMGAYETKGDRMLKIGPVASTLMACPSDSDTETALASALESADHYDMDGPMLLLVSNGELHAVFQAKPATTE